MAESKKKLLVNFVYHRPVGHAVEALKYAKGFFEANNNLEVSLLLNSKTPVELASACDWVKKAYAINVKEVLEKGKNAKTLKKVPKEWDFIVTDQRAIHGYGMDGELKNFHKLAKEFFKARDWSGYTDAWKYKLQPKSLKYKKDCKVLLKLPQNALNFAKKYNQKGLKFCVMLGGAGDPIYYPKAKLWEKIIASIKKEFPGCKIYLTGALKSITGRTNTRGQNGKQIQRLVKKFNAANCYDIGLWNQLAIMKQCNVFLSPHTGFGFLAPCVGTPWMAISSGCWPEYFLNQKPFYSILPKSKHYPYYAVKNKSLQKKLLKNHYNGFEKRLPEIIKAIKLLTSKRFTYKKAVKQHIQNIRKNGINKKALFFFDDALKP